LSYNISLPYVFETRAAQSASPSASDLNNNSVRGSSICIRLLKADDLKQITDLCVAEYGSEVSFESLLQDSKSPPSYTAIMDYLDCLLLRALVDLTMRMKLAGYDSTPTSASASALSSTSATAYIPPDHAILVACQTDSGDIVGMVEISRQPPLGDRNPPPVPIPLSLKRLYSLAVGAGEPQGWCTNLLIAPTYRGQSYSKVLMAAVEGIARCWQCQSIHLHADADSVAGKIPQRLYMNLGYEMLPDCQQDIAWMGGVGDGVEGPATSLSSSVFVIEGVPLLYLQKQL
jgi:GNAT superfamily N-acetyltransferase